MRILPAPTHPLAEAWVRRPRKSSFWDRVAGNRPWRNHCRSDSTAEFVPATQRERSRILWWYYHDFFISPPALSWCNSIKITPNGRCGHFFVTLNASKIGWWEQLHVKIFSLMKALLFCLIPHCRRNGMNLRSPAECRVDTESFLRKSPKSKEDFAPSVDRIWRPH